MQPEDAVAFRAVELINEEARAAKEHVGYASDPLEGVIDVAGGGEELMLAHVYLFAAAHVDREDMPDAVAAEGDLARPRCLRDEDLHPRHHPLECALH